MEDKDIEEIRELTALRTNYFSMIMLISGGIATLLIGKLFTFKFAFLALLGAYFDYVFVMKFTATDEKIKNILRREK